MNDGACTERDQFRAIIAAGSKSFALASRLLPEPTRSAVSVVYAWCRRCDDAIDDASPEQQRGALARLESELDEVYAERTPSDPVLAAFARVVQRFRIPRQYPGELLLGMKMDADRTGYAVLDDLLLYCYRVAGVVGIMMCHVMGLRHAAALRNAAHLGMAMQLTNICRDVREDWLIGRVYIPSQLLERAGWSTSVRELLDEADRYYASADRGIFALPWRSALAVRAARYIYAAIGTVIVGRQYDVWEGRAVTSTMTKLRHVARALFLSILEWPRRLTSPFRPAELPAPVRFPGDILPV